MNRKQYFVTAGGIALGALIVFVLMGFLNQQAVTTVDLGVARFHYQREELLSKVTREIENTKHGYAY